MVAYRASTLTYRNANTSYTGNYTVSSLGGVASGESIGGISYVEVRQIVSGLGGIASAEAIGSPTLKRQFYLTFGGIASEEAVGSPTAYWGVKTLALGGIASEEAVGGLGGLRHLFVWTKNQPAYGNLILAPQFDMELIPTNSEVIILHGHLVREAVVLSERGSINLLNSFDRSANLEIIVYEPSDISSYGGYLRGYGDDMEPSTYGGYARGYGDD